MIEPLGDGLEILDLPAGDDDIGSGAREAEREAAADAARRSGDDRNPVVEAKLV